MENDTEMKGMHSLAGCFIRQEIEMVVNGTKMYGFSVEFPGKLRTYYSYSKQESDTWIKYMKAAIGYQSFSEYYEMKEVIGKGKFGLVKLGVHKKTGEKVAIKIISKASMDEKDLQLVQTEIDIMRVSKHYHVVRLLDHFENSEYIFLVMEYLEGGSLESYLKKKSFEVSESDVSKIVKQISLGLEYLHNYGIAHRDLKPDNIMMMKPNNLDSLKIMDFGLSAIISPNETVVDGYGSLTYVAPEVLVRKPYNKEVDIWSLGVITFYALSGCYPFDDELDNEEKIAKKIVFEELEFKQKVFKKVSSNCIDFIKLCLTKDSSKRVKIADLLKHKFMNR